jgi:Fe-S oxidoreductase
MTIRLLPVAEKLGDLRIQPETQMHSTRGRARLLFEMLQGTVIGKNGWHDDHVREALDLCLACKGCKSDCPMNVDMATYRAEFLSHYYAGKLRPAAAYSMGLIYWWARLASHFPHLVNLVNRGPLISSLMKRLAGIAPQRTIPSFAKESFRDWFRNRSHPVIGKTRVILWPDTFNNFFTPSTAKAAVRVLERAGFSVIIPNKTLCCGRPLYDFGFLEIAKSLLKEVLTTLREEIRAGTPIVGLEPSCVVAFRDELMNLFPNNEDAIRLRRQTFLLSEFLQKKAAEVKLPSLYRKAIVHAHCHHAAIIKLSDEEAVLKRLGLFPESTKDRINSIAAFQNRHVHPLLARVTSKTHASKIKETADGCRRSISSQARRTQKIQPERRVKRDG